MRALMGEEVIFPWHGFIQRVPAMQQLRANRMGNGSVILGGYFSDPDTVMATRKPRKPRSVGWIQYRSADRQRSGPLNQSPPRSTRSEPSRWPCGSIASPRGFGSYQSAHHSHTLPCMSYKPQALAFFSPTGCVCLSEFPLCQA